MRLLIVLNELTKDHNNYRGNDVRFVDYKWGTKMIEAEIWDGVIFDRAIQFSDEAKREWLGKALVMSKSGVCFL